MSVPFWELSLLLIWLEHSSQGHHIHPTFVVGLALNIMYNYLDILKNQVLKPSSSYLKRQREFENL